MKILMVCDFFVEGLSYQENLLEKYYRRDGHEVVIVASPHESIFGYTVDDAAEGQPGLIVDQPDFRLYRRPYSVNLLNRIRRIGDVSRILETERPDVLFIHDVSLNLLDLARYKAHNPGVALFLSFHADYSNSGRGAISRRILHGIIRRSILAIAAPQIDRIFPIVPESSVFLHDLYGVRHEDMELLPLGFDVEEIKAVRNGATRRELRARYGIGTDETVIFTGGKFHPLKRTEYLIEAFSRLQQPGAHLVIAGADAPGGTDYGRTLIALAERTPGVILAGWLSTTDTYRHMAMSDFAVFPASQSVLWQQCIGMGLPLILGRKVGSTNRLQDAHYLNRENNVLILDPERPLADALFAAVAKLAKDKCLRDKMAEGARKAADDYFGWDKIARSSLTGIRGA